jgi:pyruvate ferredoxin oxidoreductase alpha subunit
LITSGTITSTARLLTERLRSEGENVGVLKIKMFRPFPVEELCSILYSAKKVAVIDRNFSTGAGGIFCHEVRAALCNLQNRPQVFSYIAGLGGRDVTQDVLQEIVQRTRQSSQAPIKSIWIGLQEVKRGFGHL